MDGELDRRGPDASADQREWRRPPRIRQSHDERRVEFARVHRNDPTAGERRTTPVEGLRSDRRLDEEVVKERRAQLAFGRRTKIGRSPAVGPDEVIVVKRIGKSAREGSDPESHQTLTN